MAFPIALSIKNIFKKNKSAAGQVEQVQAYSPADLAQEVKSTSEASKKKPKHGENGVCCGGCH
ncbi:MAG TPA: CCGSCS motif protein [Marinobacter sp.]|nr:CCGSCS motif protein [Marinobacter sp.]